jgi:hypothetical protein
VSRKLWCFLGVHEWAVLKEATWELYKEGVVVATGPLYHMQCQCCGRITQSKLR